MEDFLHALQGKNYQNRKVGIIERKWNLGTKLAGKCIKSILEQMKRYNNL